MTAQKRMTGQEIDDGLMRSCMFVNNAILFVERVAEFAKFHASKMSSRERHWFKLMLHGMIVQLDKFPFKLDGKFEEVVSSILQCADDLFDACTKLQFLSSIPYQDSSRHCYNTLHLDRAKLFDVLLYGSLGREATLAETEKQHAGNN